MPRAKPHAPNPWTMKMEMFTAFSDEERRRLFARDVLEQCRAVGDHFVQHELVDHAWQEVVQNDPLVV